MSKTKRRRLTCAICPIYTASSGWCAVRACRRPANTPACEYGRKLIEADEVAAYFRKRRGQKPDGSGTRKYTRRSPKVPMKLVGRENAAEAMTRHLRKNNGCFGTPSCEENSSNTPGTRPGKSRRAKLNNHKTKGNKT